ncbi:type II toxin-antitoxin system RelE family toxin [Wolbachia endosymbiont (group A) of Colletes cunicularius]|uniref:type II toxin-antitoxin system RelE family toxin n=1 Tax=Wolbachia endosymbiont (group A) of Colletes cunicularius TaxID=3139321 RepID=UPI0035C91060
MEERLTIDPINLGKPLSGRLIGSKRLRVGNYRVIYKIAKLEYTVIITEIGHRDTIYKEIAKAKSATYWSVNQSKITQICAITC